MRPTNATPILLDTLDSRLKAWAPPRPWAVAYSGGRDSATLLWALSQRAAPQDLTALWVDHGWRSPEERDAEREVVSAWCGRLGVELVCFPPPKLLIATEASARSHRYACFQSFLSDHPGASIFLAHHADDQAETILMRLLQGRSWQGLGGIPARRGTFFRPFLGLRRTLLAQVALEQAIPFHEDSTNALAQSVRNGLRLDILPQLERRFPRAVASLADFGTVWNRIAPPRDLDPAWECAGPRASVPTMNWDRWSTLERQAQLLARVNGLQPGRRLSGRFLEAVTEDGRWRGAQGAGWRWSRSGDRVRWETVAQRAPKEYFVHTVSGRNYNLGAYQMRWSREPGGPSWLFVPGIDPERGWVWRSAAAGMRFSSDDDDDWGKDLRRRRLGALGPDRCALAVQDGKIRAVVDPRTQSLVWSGAADGKLHKAGIFVSLVWVM